MFLLIQLLTICSAANLAHARSIGQEWNKTTSTPLESIVNADTGAAIVKGINCRGSILCDPILQSRKHTDMKYLVPFFDFIPKNRTYKNGQQIACARWQRWPEDEVVPETNCGICVFFQRAKPGRILNGELARQKMHELRDNQCDFCGSATLEPSGSVYDGELTVNYVDKPCPPLHGERIGLCPEKH